MIPFLRAASLRSQPTTRTEVSLIVLRRGKIHHNPLFIGREKVGTLKRLEHTQLDAIFDLSQGIQRIVVSYRRAQA